MKTRQIGRYALAVLAGSFVITSGITPLSTRSLVESLFAHSPAIAQSLVEGKGKVIAVTLEKQEVVVEHGEIKGFMAAMTMGYKVSSTSLLKGIRPGDEVRFSIDPKKSTIVKIGKLEK